MEGWGAEHGQRAHVKHPAHVRDAGRVEVQRLVERLRVLPSRKEGMRCRARCEPGGRRWPRRKWHAGGGPCSRLGGKVRAALAHEEHGIHVRDAGRVEVQRLVELPRNLPSRKEESELSGAGGCLGQRQRNQRACGGLDCVEVRAGHAGGERTRNMARTRSRARGAGHAHAEDPTGGMGAGYTRRAHGEHFFHGCDAGRVEAHRLVELVRDLPSRKEGMRDDGRGAGREAEGRGAAASASGVHAEDATGGLAHGRRVHREHVVHVRDAGRVEAHRLVEGEAVANCRVERRACHAERDAGRKAQELGGGAVVSQGARRRARLEGWGGRACGRSARRTCCSCP